MDEVDLISSSADDYNYSPRQGSQIKHIIQII
jgi:hypothetical protein